MRDGGRTAHAGRPPLAQRAAGDDGAGPAGPRHRRERGAVAQAATAASSVSGAATTCRPALDARETHRSAKAAGSRPGSIDCHTHLVYGGDRAHEFELRLKGASYEEIARAGGGIVSTVKATRAATRTTLVDAALPRLDALIAEGVTTVEIKSGYGLDPETEAQMLRAARRLGASAAVTVRTDLPRRPCAAAGSCRRQGRLYRRRLPRAAAAGRRARASPTRSTPSARASPSRRSRSPASSTPRTAHGLPVKLHAEQLSNLGGAALAARFGALSADHLEYLDDAGVAAMAKAGTVAVLLPGAFYFLRETQKSAGRCSCAATASRSRSRPTAIPAPRRSPRCCSP